MQRAFRPSIWLKLAIFGGVLVVLASGVLIWTAYLCTRDMLVDQSSRISVSDRPAAPCSARVGAGAGAAAQGRGGGSAPKDRLNFLSAQGGGHVVQGSVEYRAIGKGEAAIVHITGRGLVDSAAQVTPSQGERTDNG